MMTSNSSSRAPALLLADRFFGAIERSAIDEVRSIYKPDVLIWHNFDPLAGRLDRKQSQPLEENLALLTALPGLITDLTYRVWHDATTPDGFVRQHVVEGKTPSGEPVAFPVCVVAEVENLRISKFYEYLDVAHLPASVIDYFSQCR